MEFTLVTVHDGLSLSENLRTMEAWSIPEAYLVYIGCESKEEYIESIVTCTFDINHEDIVDRLKKERYCPINGKIVFRHTCTMRTATIIFHADATLLEDEKFLLISKIKHIQWQDDDEMVRILGTINARIALNDIKSKAMTRHDKKCITIPQSAIEMSRNVKKQLEFLQCEFSVNVSYACGDSAVQVQRSITLPSCLLLKDLPDLSYEKYWAYADFSSKAEPIFLDGSKYLSKLTGLEFMGPLSHVLPQMMTAETLNYSIKCLVPALAAMEPGSVHSDDLQLITIVGKETFKIKWYRTRSIIIGIIHVKEELDNS